jgi:crotonobetainyl-CoA:carnitine CoA-transferase CaiB-like acyl-CoA transferase
LLERARTGRGQLVEVALHDAMLSMFTFQAQGYLSSGVVPRRLGNQHPSIVPYETFESADGTVVIGVASEALWRRFCEALELPHLLHDGRFAVNAARVAHRAELTGELAPLFRRRETAHWEKVLGRAGVPCGRVRALHQVLDGERNAGREMVVRADGVDMLGVPVKLSATPGRVRRRAPRLGEHTEAVLAELGHTEEDIAAWRAAGVL